MNDGDDVCSHEQIGDPFLPLFPLPLLLFSVFFLVNLPLDLLCFQVTFALIQQARHPLLIFFWAFVSFFEQLIDIIKWCSTFFYVVVHVTFFKLTWSYFNVPKNLVKWKRTLIVEESRLETKSWKPIGVVTGS